MSTTMSGTDYDSKGVPPPARPPAPRCRGSACDAFLRVLLLAASVAAVVVMITSKQNKIYQVPVPGIGVISRNVPAKFNYSPAFVYFLVALSVAGLYSIITGLASLAIACKPSVSPKWLLILIVHDVLMLGIVASATGTAGGVAYIGLKGNSHVGWAKICNSYDKYCRHIGSAVGVSLFASVVLVLLIFFNSHSLYRSI